MPPTLCSLLPIRIFNRLNDFRRGCGFLVLPPETMISIFAFCTPTDVFHLSLACACFHRRIQAHRAYLPKHCVTLKIYCHDDAKRWRLSITRDDLPGICVAKRKWNSLDLEMKIDSHWKIRLDSNYRLRQFFCTDLFWS